MKKSYTYRVLDVFGSVSTGCRATLTTFYSWPETRDWCRACSSDRRWIARCYDEKVVLGFMSEDGRFLASNQDVELSALMLFANAVTL